VRAFSRFAASYFTPAGITAARNLAGLLLFRGVSQGCQLLIFLLLANAFSKSEFGLLLFGLSLIPYAVLIAASSTGSIFLRDVAARPERSSELNGAWWAIRLGGTMLVVAAAAAACFVAPISMNQRALYLLLTAAAASACFDLAAHYDARHRQAVHAGVLALADVALALAIWRMTSAGGFSLPAVGGAFAGKYVGGLLLQFVCAGDAAPRPVRIRIRCIRRVALASWRLGLVGLLTSAPMWAGMFLVRGFHGEAAAANHGLAIQAASIYLTAAMMLSRVLRPHIVGPYGRHAGFVKKLLPVLGTYYTGLLLLGLLGSAATILLLLPVAYRSAVLPTALALLAATIVSIGHSPSAYMLRFRSEAAMLRISAVAAVLFFALAGAIVPALGSAGVWSAAIVAAGVGTTLRIHCAVASPGTGCFSAKGD
jgi:O-antigen/teichoic acid export membrane protein